MWVLLLLGSCTAERGGPDDSEPDTGISIPEQWEPLFGVVGDPDTNVGIAGVHVSDMARPTAAAVTDGDGRWTFDDDTTVPFLTLRFSGDTRVPLAAWIAPVEAASGAIGYATRLGTLQSLVELLGAVGVEVEPGRALLFVDALDPTMRCIGGATVEISAENAGAWREAAVGEWVPESLTNEDRHDLMFVNVAPGPLTLTVVAPDGSACEVPPGVTLVADEVAQVSVYCAYRVEPE
ncbi:MAG: hypothetical protein Q8P18_28705 [Pseudomonadota bacterium]|nr:hypothetical protein [Pseudomonadota bacterium]